MISLEQIPNRTRPHKVNVAVKLLYASLAIELMLISLDGLLTGELFSVGGLVGLLFVFGLYWTLISLIGRGHKKALILFSALVILNGIFVLAVPEGVMSPLLNNWFFNLLTVLPSIVNLMALYLLFQKSSFDWFKKTEVGCVT